MSLVLQLFKSLVCPLGMQTKDNKTVNIFEVVRDEKDRQKEILVELVLIRVKERGNNNHKGRVRKKKRRIMENFSEK